MIPSLDQKAFEQKTASQMVATNHNLVTKILSFLSPATKLSLVNSTFNYSTKTGLSQISRDYEQKAWFAKLKKYFPREMQEVLSTPPSPQRIKTLFGHLEQILGKHLIFSENPITDALVERAVQIRITNFNIFFDAVVKELPASAKPVASVNTYEAKQEWLQSHTNLLQHIEDLSFFNEAEMSALSPEIRYLTGLRECYLRYMKI